jgi:hypothetical protein
MAGFAGGGEWTIGGSGSGVGMSPDAAVRASCQTIFTEGTGAAPAAAPAKSAPRRADSGAGGAGAAPHKPISREESVGLARSLVAAAGAGAGTGARPRVFTCQPPSPRTMRRNAATAARPFGPGSTKTQRERHTRSGPSRRQMGS